MSERKWGYNASCTTVIMIVLIAISFTCLSNSNIVNGLYAKYSSSQAQSFDSECGIGSSTGIDCANNRPQTQLDDSAIAPKDDRGPQGPPGKIGQTVVTLHDDEEGNAGGWNPPFTSSPIPIKVPDLAIEFPQEATFVNPPLNPNDPGGMTAGDCRLAGINTETDTIRLECKGASGNLPEEGAILTYIITGSKNAAVIM